MILKENNSFKLIRTLKKMNTPRFLIMNSLDILKITIEQPKVENGEVVRDKKGNPKPDSKLRDSERVPLSEDIEEYFTREVEPHLPNSWIDFNKSKVGYEINFTKYFYNTNLFVHQMISLMIY